jgi:hypothetical protein
MPVTDIELEGITADEARDYFDFSLRYDLAEFVNLYGEKALAQLLSEEAPRVGLKIDVVPVAGDPSQPHSN